MKLTLLLVFLNLVNSLASVYSQRVSLNFQDVRFADVIQEISRQTNLDFAYSKEIVNMNRVVSINATNTDLKNVLDKLLEGTQLLHVELNGKVYLGPKELETFINELTLRQTQKVTGIITDATTREPVPGVNIVVEGSTIGTVSGPGGEYSLEVPGTNAVLIFSFVGYSTERITVASRSTIDVGLVPDITKLEEVVVVGYGTVRKTDVTGSSSAISVKDFQNQDITRVDQALQGRASGVQVENSGGAPGANVKVRIRGANSVLGDNNPLYVVDGFVGADFNALNPQDIDDIQILKDASATAIYGSRGANGVILISTKKGKKGKMSLEFTSKLSSSTLPKKLDVLSAAEFAQVVNERNIALGFPAHFSETEMAGFRSGAHGTDWQDELYRTGIGQEYQLSISGGNDKVFYYISGNYLDQDGIVKNTNYTKYSLRSNINSNVTDKISVRLNVTATKRIRNNVGLGTAAAASAVSQALAWSPTADLIDPATGKYTRKDGLTSIGPNPLNLVYNQKNLNNNATVNAIGGIRYEFIPGLSLDISGAVDYNEDLYNNFIGGLVRDNQQSSAQRQVIDYVTLLNTNILAYEKKFGQHSINLTAVYEQSKFTDEGFNASANDLSTEKYEDYALNLGNANIYSIYHNSAIRSLLGRAVYSFNDRYSVTLSLRRDGSSKFQGDNKWSTFPSVGLAWRASEEPFIKELNLFSNLKVRASWGKTGNQSVSAYATLPTFTSSTFTFDRGSNTPILRYNQTANPDLKWETTTQINGGVDMGFFNNRVGFTFDYFDKVTSDLLIGVPLPMYNGGGTINQNVGEISNKGVEISLNVVPFASKDLNWTSGVNFSYVKNKVEALAKADSLWFSNNLTGAFSQSEMALIVGQPMGSFWGVEYLGTWKPSEAAAAAAIGKVPGDSKYADANGDGQADYKVIGNGLPKYSLGWNNTISYKNFTLNIFMQGIFGYQKWNITYAQGMTYDRTTKEAIFSDIKDRYIPGVNETSNIPAFTATNQNILQSSRFLEKGDFLRVKNIGLSYDLPKSWLKFAGARIFVNGTNLLTFTKYSGYDPETSSYGSDSDRFTGIDYGGYPNARTISGGFTLTF